MKNGKEIAQPPTERRESSRKRKPSPPRGAAVEENFENKDLTLADYVKKQENFTQSTEGNLKDENVETFYLLEYKPKQADEGTVFHPLYEIYENILNEELPMY